MIEKPPHGAPCNDCGQCCLGQRCPLGVIVFGEGEGCPALEKAGCGLVLDPKAFTVGEAPEYRLRDAAKQLVGAGFGCDALLYDETPNLGFRMRLREYARKHAAKGRRALRLWRKATPG